VLSNGGRREQVLGRMLDKASEEPDSGVLSATTTTQPSAVRVRRSKSSFDSTLLPLG
jgi:hypothetical protein